MTRKRSSTLAIENCPMPLDPAEPIRTHADHVLSDRPITRLHVHPCLELGYCHEGHGVFLIADKVRAFSQGDVVFITSVEPHFARSAPGTSSRWTWIYLEPARLVPPGAADPCWLDTSPLRGPGFSNLFTSADQPALARAIFRLAEELGGRAAGRNVVVRALVMEILVLAHRQKPAKASAKEPAVAPDYARLGPALQALARANGGPIRVGALARLCGLSEPQFRRVFRRTMGRTPLAYANDQRVQTAASLLRGTAKSVLEISLEAGFESVSSLHRAFRARMGASPRAWRTQG